MVQGLKVEGLGSWGVGGTSLVVLGSEFQASKVQTLVPRAMVEGLRPCLGVLRYVGLGSEVRVLGSKALGSGFEDGDLGVESRMPWPEG